MSQTSASSQSHHTTSSHTSDSSVPLQSSSSKSVQSSFSGSVASSSTTKPDFFCDADSTVDIKFIIFFHINIFKASRLSVRGDNTYLVHRVGILFNVYSSTLLHLNATLLFSIGGFTNIVLKLNELTLHKAISHNTVTPTSYSQHPTIYVYNGHTVHNDAPVSLYIFEPYGFQADPTKPYATEYDYRSPSNHASTSLESKSFRIGPHESKQFQLGSLRDYPVQDNRNYFFHAGNRQSHQTHTFDHDLTNFSIHILHMDHLNSPYPDVRFVLHVDPVHRDTLHVHYLHSHIGGKFQDNTFPINTLHWQEYYTNWIYHIHPIQPKHGNPDDLNSVQVHPRNTFPVDRRVTTSTISQPSTATHSSLTQSNSATADATTSPGSHPGPTQSVPIQSQSTSKAHSDTSQSGSTQSKPTAITVPTTSRSGPTQLSPEPTSKSLSASTTEYTTSTIYTTTTYTTTSCAPAVKVCPARSTVVITSTVAVSTTVCPVTQSPTTTTAPSTTEGITSTIYSTSTYTVAQCSPSIKNCHTSSPSVATTLIPIATTTYPVTESPSMSQIPGTTQWTTSTIYSTSSYTVVQCPPQVKNCPASSTVLTTTLIPVTTTICPVSSQTKVPSPDGSATTPGLGGKVEFITPGSGEGGVPTGTGALTASTPVAGQPQSGTADASTAANIPASTVSYVPGASQSSSLAIANAQSGAFIVSGSAPAPALAAQASSVIASPTPNTSQSSGLPAGDGQPGTSTYGYHNPKSSIMTGSPTPTISSTTRPPFEGGQSGSSSDFGSYSGPFANVSGSAVPTTTLGPSGTPGGRPVTNGTTTATGSPTGTGYVTAGAAVHPVNALVVGFTTVLVSLAML
ncbi:hypothetical protein VPNG_06436 [Cytospora leucostoma]|uniref:Uncharacterized protein n=1 Tax=Cytospora leucostoma TaxID=1230097 RepID=A0A423WYU9_9PEZI|nr:hypothetical protein VPNG_06436 [Cytospora leucostoma]